MKELILSECLLQRLERRGATPLSRQIYDLLRDLILAGDLPAGTKLPATRALAVDTGLSRNTVLHAYDQLLAEGYLVSAFGSGTFVSDTVPATPEPPAPPEVEAAAQHFALSRRGTKLVREASASDRQWGAFVAGVPDVSLFPRAVWQRLQSRRWRQAPPELLTYAYGAGYMPLRRALAEHLRLSRSVKCDADQIVVTSGIHQAVSVLARLLGDNGNTAWMENPGYWGARSTLMACGITPVAVAVDNEGMAPSAQQLQDPPRFIFVTPSHQYPLGMVMSLARRRMLLDYAHKRGAWIVEDDYDSEFRFDGRPIASLQGLDQHDRVLYLGTFSKTLFPGIRLAYMVLPKPLAGHVATGLSELYREGRLMDQAVLADFIEGGHYATHIRRVKQRYAARQALLREAVTRAFGADWPISTHEAGLHLVMHLPDGTDDLGISIAARTLGLHARPLSRYYASEQDARPGLLLGYACVPEEEIEPAFERLVQVITPALEHVERQQRRPVYSDKLNAEAWSGA
ncbi:PLP-dependent aminotransferase family protein [Bordetella bronchiseptica]|uniref:MocR-like pyridoxine biosynthesis transcription factor PdxR n=1 Tax=Bordetella bronchiseptica TaxID=518 RepID=UPI00045B4230|nr:PLP-dependent aminotransferase family protein [Bordetella bronchiseptica]KCV29206.1 transcriptional regulator, GntR family [Bordetella bronchiseptica 00-P-2730]AZW31823.1 PLP-dependent aminotransferase family protein [Bordetella bronchiseptica]KAK52114.1 transcriptional regulator, GntR family [Bordetella bronchiseptica OSU054]KCV43897.1 transcriptional regulator, GntR family [Bordetella bronchiseptica 345]KDB76068.1 transcriptional regulator, GntR family [Bordetella bronchiseptica CA90 BB13